MKLPDSDTLFTVMMGGHYIAAAGATIGGAGVILAIIGPLAAFAYPVILVGVALCFVGAPIILLISPLWSRAHDQEMASIRAANRVMLKKLEERLKERRELECPR